MNFLYDFLIEFVAAFLGFLFAIVFSGINAKYEARKKLKLIINGIKNELQDIHDSLNEYIENKVIMKHRAPYRLGIPFNLQAECWIC